MKKLTLKVAVESQNFFAIMFTRLYIKHEMLHTNTYCEIYVQFSKYK